MSNYSRNLTVRRVTPSVELLSSTENPIDAVYAKYRQCYYPGRVDLAQLADVPVEEKEALINKCVSSRHLTGLEAASFTFGVYGVSRVSTHQLVRHRIASFGQQSQRYVAFSDTLEYVVPKILLAPDKAEVLQDYEAAMLSAFKEYTALYEKLIALGVPKDKATEDARYLIPPSAASNIIVTMNAHALRTFFSTRCCRRAQWEIRDVAFQMLNLLLGAGYEALFRGAGAPCETLKYCPEIKSMSCNKYPSLVELIAFS